MARDLQAEIRELRGRIAALMRRRRTTSGC